MSLRIFSIILLPCFNCYQCARWIQVKNSTICINQRRWFRFLNLFSSSRLMFFRRNTWAKAIGCTLIYIFFLLQPVRNLKPEVTWIWYYKPYRICIGQRGTCSLNYCLIFPKGTIPIESAFHLWTTLKSSIKTKPVREGICLRLLYLILSLISD